MLVVKFMPVGFALLSADQSAHGQDEAIIMALTYRSFPAETLNSVLKVVVLLTLCKEPEAALVFVLKHNLTACGVHAELLLSSPIATH